MVQIELNEEERQILTEILDGCLSELQSEIHHTDRFEYTDMLKHRRDVIKKVLSKVQASVIIEA